MTVRPGAWPDVLPQGPHRKLKLPGSSMPVSDFGCLLMCYVQACHDLEVDPTATPASIIAATKDLVGADRVWFAGLPVQPQLAKVLGLTAGELVRSPPQPAQEMRRVLVEALGVGLAVLWVDHDETRGGDFDGDHFVLGRRIDGDRIWYADPATGEEGWLNLRTLSGVTVWQTSLGPVTKVYQVRSVRPLAHLPVR